MTSIMLSDFHFLVPEVTKFDLAVKGQPSVIIYTNYVELESPMLHAKFQDHRTTGSGEEDF